MALDVPRFTTVDPLAEKYYSVSPYVYCLNNPLLYTDPKGDSVRVYVETTGSGHSWISVGEGDNMVIYSYEPLNRDAKLSSPENLRVLKGKHAKDYNNAKMKETAMYSYVVSDLTDQKMTEVMDGILSSATKTWKSPGDEDKGTTTNNIVEDYFLLGNNCTTVVSDALNQTGSKVLERETYNVQIPGGVKKEMYNDRYIIPSTFRHYLDAKSNQTPQIIYQSYRHGKKK